MSLKEINDCIQDCIIRSADVSSILDRIATWTTQVPAGCDYADPGRQPRLREFIDIETEVLSNKGNPNTPMSTSPCVIRAAFYAENLLLFSEQAKGEGVLPLPIGETHTFAPVALGDIAHVAAHVLAGKGKHGFDNRHRGQMMVITGPTLCNGKELAATASNALGTTMKFENISEAEAKRVLASQSDSDDAEKQYILEYYSLVREGKTNYISTKAFHDVTGVHPTGPDSFFSDTWAARTIIFRHEKSLDEPHILVWCDIQLFIHSKAFSMDCMQPCLLSSAVRIAAQLVAPSGEKYATGSEIAVSSGHIVHLEVENMSTRPLYVHPYVMGPFWQVYGVLSTEYAVIPPKDVAQGFGGKLRKKLRMTVPDTLKLQGQLECVDVLKIFFTARATSFLCLELAKLGVSADEMKTKKPSSSRLSLADNAAEACDDWATFEYVIRSKIG